jgi:hypothetical protein
MSSQTPAGWFPDPHDESQFRYWDGNQWTDNRAPRAPQAPAPGPGAAPTPPPAGSTAVLTAPSPPASDGQAATKKNWFLRHKILSAVLAFFAVIIIATAASGAGGGSSPDTAGGGNHATKDKPSSAPPSGKADNSGQNVEGSSAYGSAKMPLQNGDWRLDSIQVKNDGLGDLGGVARVTYTGKDQTGGDNLFTVTLFKGKNVVGTLNGAANSVKPGTTVTVQLISADNYVGGPYKYDFQHDL